MTFENWLPIVALIDKYCMPSTGIVCVDLYVCIIYRVR